MSVYVQRCVGEGVGLSFQHNLHHTDTFKYVNNAILVYQVRFLLVPLKILNLASNNLIRILASANSNISKFCLSLTSVMIFNSAIISNNSFYSAELASFLAPVVGQKESKWNLCYNAIAKNWNLQQFHKNCDNKNHTVTIIEKEPYIFGGYTDIPWGNFQFLSIC